MTLTTEEEQAHRVALQIVYEVEQGGHRAGKISSLDEQLARALLSLKGKLEEATEVSVSLCSDAQSVGYYGDDPDSALTCFRSAIEQAVPKSELKACEAELTEARRQLRAMQRPVNGELLSALKYVVDNEYLSGWDHPHDICNCNHCKIRRLVARAEEAEKAPQPTQEKS